MNEHDWTYVGKRRRADLTWLFVYHCETCGRYLTEIQSGEEILSSEFVANNPLATETKGD